MRKRDFGFDFKEIGIAAFVYSIILFLQIPAQYVWAYQSSFAYTFFMAAISLLCCVRHFQIRGKLLFVSLALFVLLLVFHMTGRFTMASLLRAMLIFSLFFVKPSFFQKIFKAFTLIFSIMMIPSIIEFVLVEFHVVNLPYKIVGSPYANLSIIFKVYPFHVIRWDITNFIIPRFSACFDEPGVVGTICGTLLCCQRMKINRLINIPILIAGILSFSLFFYSLLVLYLLIFAGSSWYRKIVLVGLMVGVGFYLFSINNEVINTYIIQRLDYDEEKGVTGNNRTTGDFRVFYSQFRKSNYVWFGLGRGAKQIYDVGGASYKDRILEYGYVGFGLYMALMLCYARTFYGKNRKKFWIAAFVFMTCIMQRPFIDFHFYMVLFMFMMCCVETAPGDPLERLSQAVDFDSQAQLP